MAKWGCFSNLLCHHNYEWLEGSSACSSWSISASENLISEHIPLPETLTKGCGKSSYKERINQLEKAGNDQSKRRESQLQGRDAVSFQSSYANA